MGLKEYQAKRRFDKTPEPKGQAKRSRGALRFVVQKHHASRLHYDFRLEVDGVLKSWAVPKGPSLNPTDKRLAMMVEDHPLDYRAFEGIIPEGNYGAGTVMVWDEGIYEPIPSSDTRAEREAGVREGLESGHLKFVLLGHKLKGSFVLVRIKPSGGGGKAWLLIKHDDEFATTKDVTDEDRSALTERTLEEIAAEAVSKGEVWQSNRSDGKAGKSKKSALARKAATPPASAPDAPLPRNIKPMLAMLVEEPFDRPGWLFEVKWDGFRAIGEVEKGKANIYSRNRISFADRFPAVAKALTDIGHDAVVDGEIVVLDDQGRSKFELIQNYQSTGKGTLAYYLFDLLWLDGKDLRDLPLIERKKLLAALLPGSSLLRQSEHVKENGIAFLEAARKMELEGIIAKKEDSKYREGTRSASWLKMKIRKQQEAVIGGFTQPRGSRDKLGALILGVYDGKDLLHIGQAGSGFNSKTLPQVYAKLEPLIQKECPFKARPKTDTKPTWVKPEFVCEIAFQNWTDEGIVRMPIFLGMREDKEASTVKREEPQPLPAALKKGK